MLFLFKRKANFMENLSSAKESLLQGYGADMNMALNVMIPKPIFLNWRHMNFEGGIEGW